MNRDILSGQWTQLKGKIRERWGKLTDDDLDKIAGKRDQLIGTLQEKYGQARDKVEEEVREFESRMTKEFGPSGREAASASSHTSPQASSPSSSQREKAGAK